MPRPSTEPVPESPGPKRAGQTSSSTRSLVWLLLLIAIFAALWYVYGRPDDEPEALPVETVLPALASDEDGSEAEEIPVDEPAAGSVSQPTAAPPPPSLPDRPAEPTLQVQPAYPPAALRVREEGTVLLRVEVDAQGRPTTVEIQRSSRSRDLDRAAREAVGQWTFQPAIENGQPTASTVTVPVDFRIGDP